MSEASQVKVWRNLAINGETFPLLVETGHDGITVSTAVHRQQHEHRQGGVRFVRRGTHEELGHLARGMTEKCAAARVPLDGLKCMVIAPGGEPAEPKAKAALLAEHFRAVIKEDAGVIFGPDMGCPEEVLSEVASFPGLLVHLTGLTALWGGLEIDKRGYTAFGLVHAIEAAVPDCIPSRSFGIQGFGAVGSGAVQLVANRNGLVRAVSNKEGVLIANRGLDVRLLCRLWKDLGDACLAAYPGQSRCDGAEFRSRPEDLFDVEMDVFLPAARTSVLAMSEELPRTRWENPDVCDMARFVAKSGVKLIVEGANHPLSEAAEAFGEKQGVVVLPDVLVNCGGMIGCRIEWQNRIRSLKSPERLTELDRLCRAQIEETINRNVNEVRSSPTNARHTANRIVQRELARKDDYNVQPPD